MSKDVVYANLRTFIAARSGQTVSDDDSLIESGVFDSLGILELVAYIEKEFALQLRDEDVSPENFGSIRRVAGFVVDRMGP
jgi:acyl carrier protein